MPGYFQGTDGDLENTYVTDYAMIDQYAKTGSLWMTGGNSYGSLGTNAGGQTTSPVQTVAAGTNWKQASYSASNAGAVKTDGTLWLWGRNNYGQLGDNTGGGDSFNKSSPVQTVAAGTNWKQLSIGPDGGSTFVSAVKTDGTLWTWGKNDFYQLGDGTATRRSSPGQMSGGGNNWKQVSSGGQHASGIKTDGTLWMWGSNHYGQAGINSNSGGGNWGNLPSTPVQTIAAGTNWKQVECGQFHTAAIKTDGTLWVWGRNSYGQLGRNNNTDMSSPVQTSVAGTNWKQVSGKGQSVAAIKTDGTLWLWGRNFYGGLGDGTVNARSYPAQTVAGGSNWKFVDTSQFHTAAIKTDGTLWTWGGTGARLGQGSFASKSSPAQTVAGGSNWKTVATGTGGTAAIYFYDAGNLYPSA